MQSQMGTIDIGVYVRFPGKSKLMSPSKSKRLIA